MPVAMMRRTLPAMMCLMLGTQVCLESFFLSLLGCGGGKAGGALRTNQSSQF
jgi:hypothetical protein